MTDIAVRCANLSKYFGQTPAVQGITLELEEGKSLALLGPSGCGKTTLLRLIAGLDRPDSGTIEITGKMVTGQKTFLPPEKRRVGIVFQDYALFTHLDVASNIAYGLNKSSNRQERVKEMLSLVGLAGFERRMPHQLSGGEQQRVALARALAPRPAVLLMDEPFSNLDADLRVRIRADVKEILNNTGATVIFVTHDQEEAFFMGDRVGVMNKGRLEQIDSPENVFHRPASPFVAQFVGTADFLTGEVQDSVINTEVGQISLTEKLPPGTKVTVMVRPDFVDIQPAPDGAGIIMDRVFQGISYLYRVKLSSGATVQSQQHHNRYYPVQTRVALKINPGHNLAYFADRANNETREGASTNA